MAAMKPRTGDGPLEATKEGRGIVMRVPLEGGGRLVVELTPEEAAVSKQRNVITRALGGALQVTPDASEIDAKPGDVFLLCSDGLTGMVPESEILRVVTASSGDLKKACQQLIDAANERGGLDNVTAVLVETL